jgi:hypothetical protein
MREEKTGKRDPSSLQRSMSPGHTYEWRHRLDTMLAAFAEYAEQP